MKSLKKSQRKLTINASTIRTLAAVELRDVNGGFSVLDSDCRYCAPQLNTYGDDCRG